MARRCAQFLTKKLGVCLIESESGRDTSKEIVKANGGKALGLFQINSKDWCKYGSPGGKCNMKCEALTDDNIRDDSVCAQKIQAELGFRGWDGWKRSCYRRTYTTTIVSACIPAN
nr:lysozyme-like [Leptinotarsa decemlineata]